MAAAFISFIRPVNFDSIAALLTVCNEQVNQGATELHLLLSSGGGQIIPGFAAFHQLLAYPVPVTTYNIGSINSIANIIFLSGAVRKAAANATFLFHGSSWTFGNHESVQRTRLQEIVTSLDADEMRMKEVFVSRTNIPRQTIDDLMTAGSTKDAVFASQVGIVHEVVEPAIPPGTPVFQI